ncbi:DedA family protein [uncultured Nocardioides sp.]|uniref:DedA protein n=1 Tax=uncultured Nocardioides sp. TaxID=198441 RepID=A0A6J4N0X1_9ACTN|nr:VTT domain-containing protein [uncultured Nocardioides sp.]CAA9371469.1 MAG: DedA protein [uncultured Nocardioides sp.]
MTAQSIVQPLLLGMDWMDPNWLLDQFGTELFWISLAIIFVECGLFFPFLPGDTLLFALGLFIAAERIDVFGTPPFAELLLALVLLSAAAFLGNVCGYEIGRRLGPPLYEREGRILKRKYFDQTQVFFDKHGNKALVIGRFVPFVRTFITVVAGVTRMDRRRFFLWSAIGAVAWVMSITLLGYFLGQAFPGLGENIDKAIIVILAFSVIPIVWEWWRHRRTHAPEAEDRDADGRPDRDILGSEVD